MTQEEVTFKVIGDIAVPGTMVDNISKHERVSAYLKVLHTYFVRYDKSTHS